MKHKSFSQITEFITHFRDRVEEDSKLVNDRLISRVTKTLRDYMNLVRQSTEAESIPENNMKRHMKSIKNYLASQ